MDTTEIEHLDEIVNNFFAAEGFESGAGDYTFQVAPRGNANITKWGKQGWYTLGAGETKAQIVLDQKFYDLNSGTYEALLAKLPQGKSVSISMSLMCLTLLGMEYAFATTADKITQTDPTSAINTTVDDSTAPTLQVIKVNSVANMEPKQRIRILTGDSDYKQRLELKHIQEIDVTNKLITLVQPLEHLPLDGADVKVVKYLDLDVADLVPDTAQGRLIQFNPDKSWTAYHFPKLDLSKAGIPSGSGKEADKASIELAVPKDWYIDGGKIASKYFSMRQGYKTTFS